MIVIFGKENCPSCINAKTHCEKNNLEYVYSDIFEDEEAMEKIVELGAKTVPQIWVEGVHVGGYESFVEYLNSQTKTS